MEGQIWRRTRGDVPQMEELDARASNSIAQGFFGTLVAASSMILATTSGLET